jgi:hypothetical protein
MRVYGIRRADRITCGFRRGKGQRVCRCGDTSSKHPKYLQKDYNMSKRLKRHARQQSKKLVSGLE